MTHSIRKWSDEVDAKLQDCFSSIDWKMFRDLSNGIEEFTTNKYIDDVDTTVTVRTYLNQKPWITGSIHTELKAKAVAFNKRDTNLDPCQAL